MKIKNKGLGYTKIKIHFDRVSEEWAKIEGLVAPNLRGYINHVNDVSEDSIDEAYALRLADHKLSCLMSEWMELRDVIKAAKAAGITASNNSVISELYFKQTIEVFQKIINLDRVTPPANDIYKNYPKPSEEELAALKSDEPDQLPSR